MTYQRNVYSKDLSWLHWAKVSGEAANERLIVLHICFYSLSDISKYQLGAPSQILQQYFMEGCMVDFIEIESNLRKKELHITNQSSNFLGGTPSNRDNVRDSVQFRWERESQYLRRWFFFKNRPIHFIESVDWSIKASWVFQAWKSRSHFLPLSKCLIG